MWMGRSPMVVFGHGPEGELIMRFDVGIGLGIHLLQHAGLAVAFLSGAKQLWIHHCRWVLKTNRRLWSACASSWGASAQIVFVADDVNDLALHGSFGLLVATADAAAPLRRPAFAVRELAEQLLHARGLWA